MILTFNDPIIVSCTLETLADINKVFAEADCLKSSADIEAAIDQMGMAITEQFKESNPVIICVMKGGLIFTTKLLERLQFPLEVDYLHATRYQNSTVGGDTIEWLAKPQTDLTGRSVILVDDILDVGSTLKSILASPLMGSVKTLHTAVLIDKQHDRKVDPDFKADFTGLTIEDRYIFGYGMDYKGYLRNAPGIFAVKGL